MHVHYVHEAYREELETKVKGDPDGFPIPEWNVETHLKMMEHLGRATAM